MPYAITVDFETLEGDSVTLRERDSMSQVRGGRGRARCGSMHACMPACGGAQGKPRCARATPRACMRPPLRVALQVRVPVPEVAPLIRQLVDAALTWADVAAKYPAQKAAAEDGKDEQ